VKDALGAQATSLQNMNVVLLRVGLDYGCGGALSPLLPDGRFEFIPIPDTFGLDERTYGNTIGRHGRCLAEYLPDNRRRQLEDCPMHVDPEFEAFTYGDSTPLKRRLSTLQRGDLLVFYAGLLGWGHERPAALYIVGFFEVEAAGIASELGDSFVREHFSANFHVRHESMYLDQRERLALVKGSSSSKLLTRPYLISRDGRDKRGTRLHVLSEEMQKVFGNFNGRISIQRSNPRWVAQEHLDRAAEFVRQLS
jgi:hypothetical protein